MTDEPKYAPVAMDKDGNTFTCCEACGSRNLNYDGADIDKCRDCGHWRYRGQQPTPLTERSVSK